MQSQYPLGKFTLGKTSCTCFIQCQQRCFEIFALGSLSTYYDIVGPPSRSLWMSGGLYAPSAPCMSSCRPLPRRGLPCPCCAGGPKLLKGPPLLAGSGLKGSYSPSLSTSPCLCSSCASCMPLQSDESVKSQSHFRNFFSDQAMSDWQQCLGLLQRFCCCSPPSGDSYAL